MTTSPIRTIRIPASALLLGVLTSWLVFPALAANVTWDFNADPSGKTVPFSEAGVPGGVTATFSQVPIPFQPNLFSIQDDLSVFGAPGFTPSSWGHYMYDGLPGTTAAQVLDIKFNTPLTSISFDFATPIGSDPIAILLTTLVGSATATGAITPGVTLPNGSLSFTSVTPFSDVQISVPANPDGIQAFIVDNVTVTPAVITPVPDQAVSLVLTVGVLSALVLVARRQQKTSLI